MKRLLFMILMLVVGMSWAHEEHSHKAPLGEIKEHVGERFIPTEDLKIRMEKILTLVKNIQPKKSDVKEVKKTGDALSKVVADIFKTCKLEDDADEAIHPILGQILQGASAFQKGDFKAGLPKIHTSLLEYEKRFSHAGWKH